MLLSVGCSCPGEDKKEHKPDWVLQERLCMPASHLNKSVQRESTTCFWHTLFIITFTCQCSAYTRVPLPPSLLWMLLSCFLSPCCRLSMSSSLQNTPFLLLAVCLLFICVYISISPPPHSPLLPVPCRGARCLWKVWWDLENLSSFPDKHYRKSKQKIHYSTFSFDPAAFHKEVESRSYYFSEIKISSPGPAATSS